MFWRVPSSSVESLSDVSVGLEEITASVRKSAPKSQKVTNARISKAQHDARRPRSGASVDPGKKIRILNAMKQERRRMEAKKCDWTYVFVGNFGPTVDEKALTAFFKRCGRISRLDIRCSGGLIMPMGVPKAGYYSGHITQQYAVVLFTKAEAARKALALNGAQLHGAELVVSRSASDLPLVKEKLERHLLGYRNRTGQGDTSQRQSQTTRALRLEPTVLLYEKECSTLGSIQRLEKRNAFKIFGFSIPNTVM
ncbi:hypothetical protein BV22DRAFT_1028846 [Leucogyrophana mollusca]|uniref:Uncharacterized protein n=1 Tax=Leucogyrophana mollusca TaxID=85980 RepID=A0ACB8BY70_9AGAM|nr:hypothetical protein BV22DRAFT_1028846 [Leucogyrophana mollusca]